MFGGIAGLHPLEASSHLPPTPPQSCNSKKCLQTKPNIPRGKTPMTENHCSMLHTSLLYLFESFHQPKDAGLSIPTSQSGEKPTSQKLQAPTGAGAWYSRILRKRSQVRAETEAPDVNNTPRQPRNPYELPGCLRCSRTGSVGGSEAQGQCQSRHRGRAKSSIK